MNNLKEAFYDLYTRLVEKTHEHQALRDKENPENKEDIWFENGAIRGLKEAIDLLKIVENEYCESNGWISVDDELPTNGSICFVLREKIDVSKFPSYIPVPIHFMNSYYCRVDKTIYKDDHFTCDENSREKVTHWVLAPEEPQE